MADMIQQITPVDAALHANMLRAWCIRYWAKTFVEGARLIRLNYGRQKMHTIIEQMVDGVWRAYALNNDGVRLEGVGLGMTEDEAVVALAADHYRIMVTQKSAPTLPEGLPNRIGQKVQICHTPRMVYQVTGWNAIDKLWQAEAVEPRGMVATQYREEFLAFLESDGSITS
jgi:hypothetical protein